jgi:hypothetical protein
VPSDRDTPSGAPGQSRTSRTLAILRLITLACAAVMACAPDYRLDAAVLAGVAIVRP